MICLDKEVASVDEARGHVEAWLALVPLLESALREESASGILVVVRGDWLVKHGLAEGWYQVRGMDRWGHTPEGVVDGQITEDFVDYLSLEQARLMGVC